VPTATRVNHLTRSQQKNVFAAFFKKVLVFSVLWKKNQEILRVTRLTSSVAQARQCQWLWPWLACVSHSV